MRSTTRNRIAMCGSASRGDEPRRWWDEWYRSEPRLVPEIERNFEAAPEEKEAAAHSSRISALVGRAPAQIRAALVRTWCAMRGRTMPTAPDAVSEPELARQARWDWTLFEQVNRQWMRRFR